MHPIFSSAAHQLQRLLPQAWSAARSQGSNVSSQLTNVRQAGAATKGCQTTYSDAKELILRKACEDESGARRGITLKILNIASGVRRLSNDVQAERIVTAGKNTFFGTKVAAAAVGAVKSRPEILHEGWQANLRNGITALIKRAGEQVFQVQSDASLGVKREQRSSDAFLNAIRVDSSKLKPYYDAIIDATKLNKAGRHKEALDLLRDAPDHQKIMAYFRVPPGAHGSEKADRALSHANEARESFHALVDGHAEPAGVLGQQVAYARKNPDVLGTRGLVQSVAAELYLVGAYNDVIATLLPPVPPRTAA
ncbi:hypothetical protein [Pinirhizobacter sp.]|uniref:hypothetical protein n=1 Tax=Pinirhizobacter sp. TaxID=2950432 RepID=UPI002F3F06B4